jgi:60 kDa SS-A/Ro ribonucleoprotein
MNSTIPDVPMAMLTSLALTRKHWTQIALRASWHTTRMNLNTFERHGVYEDAYAVSKIAQRLRDPALIAKAGAMPFQLLAAYKAALGVPDKIRAALHDAMEIAAGNVPVIDGKVWVLLDVSGSMDSPVTGERGNATSSVRCLDAAALIAASILRKNQSARVVPFDTEVRLVDLDPRERILVNAERLSALSGGGTACSAPLHWLNRNKHRGDVVIFVSDNESWADLGRASSAAPPTPTVQAWLGFKRRNPRAKLVCIDLQPGSTTQAPERTDTLNIGGFSDAVFDLLAQFVTQGVDARRWTDVIDRITLN